LEQHTYRKGAPKTPEEVSLLREVYRPGFFLIGIASNDDEQHRYLTKVKGLSDDEAQEIVQRDQDERLDYGQRTRDTFYLADVFVDLAESESVKAGWRAHFSK